jgi:WD40 repeat protein
LLQHQTRGFKALALAPDGKTLAAAGWDEAVHVCDLAGSEPQEGPRERALTGHRAVINTLCFSPADDGPLASGSSDRTVRLWDLRGGKAPVVLEAGEGKPRISRVAFSPDGRRVAAVTDGFPANPPHPEIFVWDVRGHDLVETARPNGFNFSTAAFSPDGTELLTGDQDGHVRLWAAAGLVERDRRRCHPDNWVLGLAFTRDGKALATAGGDGVVRLWDLGAPGKK